MKLRDLTDKELEELREECRKDLTDWLRRIPNFDKSGEDVWKAGFSAGMSAILRRIDKLTP